jgi:hypothetical protein
MQFLIKKFARFSFIYLLCSLILTFIKIICLLKETLLLNIKNNSND